MTTSPEQGGSSNLREHIEVAGHQLEAKVKELLHEGNVQHLIIKHEGQILLEIPVGLGIAAALLAPLLAAVAAAGALLSHCTIEVVRKEA